MPHLKEQKQKDTAYRRVLCKNRRRSISAIRAAVTSKHINTAMPYAYDNPNSLEDLPSVGTKQCVALAKFYAKAPPSSLWKEGAAVKGNLLLREGTAIATFVDGRYPNRASGNHAALYVGQDAGGIYVIDQWSKVNKIQARKLPFLGKEKQGNWANPSNNGDAFSVVE